MVLEECGSGIEGGDMGSGLGQGQMEKSEGLCCDGQPVSLIWRNGHLVGLQERHGYLVSLQEGMDT